MQSIKTDAVSLKALRRVYYGPACVALNENDMALIVRSRQTISDIIEEGRSVYGVNTGFGLLAKENIAADKLTELQRNIVLSHSAGVGEPLSENVTRLAMVLKILGLARGHSGVRIELIEALNSLLASEIYPLIPGKGSVGASGDLAPLAAMAGVLIGVGEAFVNGERMAAGDALESAGLSAITLGAKEGLALLNGTQISTALALGGLFEIENIFAAAVVAGGLSVDAACGSDTPFDPRIHAARGQKGQIDVARHYLELLDGSDIRASHVSCQHVQDPYCLRCQPQVMGAALDMIRSASETLLIEANAVSDNPLIFPDDGDVLSGGNFHAEPIAMAADVMAIALAEIGNMSERRVALLMDANLSNQPAFLVDEPGINSGFMMAQVTAAALVSENKHLANPTSTDSIPTSANQEDHVSMATHGARRLHEMAANARSIIAVELLAACQGVELRAPLKTAERLRDALDLVRGKVAFYGSDRRFTPDLNEAAGLVGEGAFRGYTPGLLPSD
jgi:histidine ammonia-lyase